MQATTRHMQQRHSRPWLLVLRPFSHSSLAAQRAARAVQQAVWLQVRTNLRSNTHFSS
jgi:hypothetical protein